MKKLYIYLISFILLSTIGACSDDIDPATKRGDEWREPVPVEFDIVEAISLDSRAIQNESKLVFSEGDLIHVGATFYSSDGSEVSKAYTIMTLSNGAWVQSSNFNRMMWPGNAYKGKFEVYYVAGNFYQVALEPGEKFPKILKLSDFEDTTDPLYAEREELWGHKITLQFSHICTHLTFTNLEPDIADYFWLVNKGDEDFCNGFSLRVDSLYNIIAEFSKVPDTNYDGLVYVQHKSKEIYDESNMKTGSEVSFFLQPGDYSYIELRTINNHSYLSYQSELTSNLEANTPYVIEFNKNKGFTFVEEQEEWTDPDEDTNIIDVNPFDFIKSIIDNTDYVTTDQNGDSVVIIERTAAGVILHRNVSFNYDTDYVDRFGGSIPDVPTGRYFDGGNHFICDIATNIFNNNNGTIQHLGLHNMKCKPVLSAKAQKWGALCIENYGKVDNVRIDNSEILFSVGENESIHSFDIGTLIGRNSGTLSNLVYSGDKISIVSENLDNVEATVNIGGFVGQLATGTISGINPYETATPVEVVNKLNGERGTFYVGGAIGVAGTNVEEISIPSVKVDCSESTGLIIYTGGVVGRLRSAGDNSSLSSCTVGGEVKGGDVRNIQSASVVAFSYTGGIAGNNFKYNVTDCRSVCNVYGPTDASINTDETFAVGGAFGRIISKSVINGNYALGAVLTGPDGCFIGNFAGIVPSDIDWNSYQAAGNVVKDILGNGKNIGASIDDNSEN